MEETYKKIEILLVICFHMFTFSWYRGKVVQILEPATFEILFVDTGETETVQQVDVLPLTSRFQRLPFQAIECSLRSLESHGQSLTLINIYIHIYDNLYIYS